MKVTGRIDVRPGPGRTLMGEPTVGVMGPRLVGPSGVWGPIPVTVTEVCCSPRRLSKKELGRCPRVGVLWGLKAPPWPEGSDCLAQRPRVHHCQGGRVS